MIKKIKKKKPKSIAKIKKEVQTLFNKKIRERDSSNNEFVCISCGLKFPIVKMQAGHFFSTKGVGWLRFHEDNVNGECWYCNGFNRNHQIWYAVHLKEKIGEVRFNNLLELAKIKPKKDFTREELEILKEKYK